LHPSWFAVVSSIEIFGHWLAGTPTDVSELLPVGRDNGYGPLY
jgi:hypothetical protein